MDLSDPMLCQTLLLTYDERDKLDSVAQEWGVTPSQAARTMALNGILGATSD